MRIINLLKVSLELQGNTDFQLIASELDTSLKLLFCVEDSDNNVKFSEFLNELKNNDLGMNYDDNTTLYEYDDYKVVFHETIYDRYFIFDSYAKNKIKAILQL